LRGHLGGGCRGREWQAGADNWDWRGVELWEWAVGAALRDACNRPDRRQIQGYTEWPSTGSLRAGPCLVETVFGGRLFGWGQYSKRKGLCSFKHTKPNTA